MQMKKDTTTSRRLEYVTKLYATLDQPSFSLQQKHIQGKTANLGSTINYAGVLKKELVKSLGLTFLFIVLQCILYLSYFRHL